MKIFEDKKLQINLPTFIDSRGLLCANSGGGKSYTLRKILETAGADVMSIILDVEGEFKTLREKFDFLLIGPGGDVPVNMKAARLLPAKLMELRVSTIIDISDLKLKERVQYVKQFIDSLMELPRKYWRPCLVTVDEAHMYCGQQEKQDSTHSVIDLMTRGRKRGYCGILATQRISKLHKDAAAEANNYMVGRTGLDIDMKRAAELLGFTAKTDMLSLRNLKPGEFFVFGPAISTAVTKAKVAKVKTTHPKVGMDLRGKITPPTEKIKSILSKLNDLPREAEEKAKTLQELRKKNTELKRQLQKRPQPAIDEKQLKTAEQRAYATAYRQYDEQIKNLQRIIQSLQIRLKNIAELTKFEQKELKVTRTKKFALPPRPARKVTDIPSVPKPPTKNRQEPIEAEIGLNRCERCILSLLYNNPARGFTKTLLGLFTGYSHKSGGFNNAISRLNTAGYIQRSNGQFYLQPDNEFESAKILGDDINLHEQFTIDNWARKLPKCESKIFSLLKENPGIDFTKEEIGEQTDYAAGSGGFNNAISRLNQLGLIKREAGRIQINKEIFNL